MTEVVVGRTTGERKAAGDRDAAGIGGVEPEGVEGEEQRAAEAAVEVEVGDVVDADAGATERRPRERPRMAGDSHSRACSAT